VLANNAGGVFGDRTKTVDGFEETFQVNHLAPFLLTRLLIDKLIASGAALIQTSSIGARMAGRLDIDDLDLDRHFSPVRVYNAAKLENILFTRELHRRYHARGISAAAFYPGNVASSFAAESDSRLMKFIATNRVTRAMLISPDKGADQLVWIAEGPARHRLGIRHLLREAQACPAHGPAGARRQPRPQPVGPLRTADRPPLTASGAHK
jgi:NAD(P)-dependent dehydrogenase (short-subunit alcohol dehydrogenase family)